MRVEIFQEEKIACVKKGLMRYHPFKEFDQQNEGN